MPTEAVENLHTDYVIEVLGDIVAGASFHYTPDAIRQGIPGDPLKANRREYFVQAVATDPISERRSPEGHVISTRFQVWCISSREGAFREVANMKADALRALLAREGEFQTKYRYGLVVEGYQLSPEMLERGIVAGLQEIRIEAQVALDAF